MRIESFHNDDDIREINVRAARADGYGDLVSSQPIKILITVTPINKTDSIDKFINNINKTLMMGLDGKYGYIDGFACIENQKKRASDGVYIPHLHIALHGKMLNRASLKNIRNKVLSLLCHGTKPLCKREHVDITQVYKKSGLATYLKKCASSKLPNGHDILSPLAEGLIPKRELVDAIAKQLQKWRTH